ncbi:hypothetical protein DFQ28_004783 [Apophysomyces sp. BC1034]|nr:hypothetical protein DFQ30_000332 [Apophysomyces sp. BC1015]KAG0178209.1 hypothetical protein DFQ29_003805 [Apophysomyces sp. BC1021]KAG0188493.1 hypothetical protein DFQ28_004783 [Apophysomyces sp. BC1034]
MDQIVLLDTNSELDEFTCVSVPFDKSIPEYYAISYRWGQHKRWEIETKDYTAVVTSVSQENLIKLCRMYHEEVRYIWIDVVCINQTDRIQRKAAISRMDEIYERSTKIIAVPDLCYCDRNPRMPNVTAKDVERAIKEISHSENKITNHRFNKKFIDDERKDVLSTAGSVFILEVVHEWAERCWVVSERVIGDNGKKLDVVIFRANKSIPYRYWPRYLKVDWQIHFDQAVAIKTIINAESTKYVDRLFAILPHTKYKSDMLRLVDRDQFIPDMTDLKMTLMSILDKEGKVLLLEGQYFDREDDKCKLPSFIKNHKSDLLPHNYTNVECLSTVKVGKSSKEYVLRIKGRFIEHPLSSTMIYPKTINLLKTKTRGNLKNGRVVDIILCKRAFKRKIEHVTMRCVGVKGIWVVDRIESSKTGKYDKYKEDSFEVY